MTCQHRESARAVPTQQRAPEVTGVLGGQFCGVGLRSRVYECPESCPRESEYWSPDPPARMAEAGVHAAEGGRKPRQPWPGEEGAQFPVVSLPGVPRLTAV